MALPFLVKKFIGVDIGSTAIKVVEISSAGKRAKLENFGEIPAEAIFKEPFSTFEKTVFYLSIDNITKGIKTILEEAQIKTKTAFFSIPDFTTFFTIIELPPMTKKEIPLAVETEARKHIPVPLSEVAYDWQVLNLPEIEKEKKIKILLVAVPHDVINRYQMIAQDLGLKLISIESEVFSLARVFGEDQKTILIVDIGAQTTSCSIVENKMVKRSFSLDFGGFLFSERIAKSLGVGLEEGENLKKEFGIEERGGKIREILLPLVNQILSEVEKMSLEYTTVEKGVKKTVDKIIFTGGGSNLPGLVEYGKNKLRKEVEIGDPFKKIVYPPILQEILKEIGPSFSIAVGLALKGIIK